MGMFDTIMVKETKCPICHKFVDLGFQTKAFERNLAAWLEGEELIYQVGIEPNIKLRPLRMFNDVNAVLTMAFTFCPNCKVGLYADFLIYHSQIVTCLKITDEEEVWASALVDYVTYFLDFEPKTEKTAKYRFKDGKAEKIK